MNGVHIEQGTAVLFGMTMAILALCGLLAYLVDDIIRLRAGETAGVEADHDRCLARIILEMGDIATAYRLRDIADNYDTVEGRRIMADAKKGWTADGPPMPVLWLRHHADLLYPDEHPLVDRYYPEMDGETS